MSGRRTRPGAGRSPKNAPTVGATSVVRACREETLPDGDPRVTAADEERDGAGGGVAVVAGDRVGEDLRVAEAPPGLAEDHHVARLRAQPQPVGAAVPGLQHAGHVLGDPADPAYGLVPLGARPGPVDEVGAAVVGDHEAPLEERVGRERALQRDQVPGVGPVHRVVGEHHDDGVLPAAAGLELVDEAAHEGVGGDQREASRDLERGAGQVGVPEPVDVAEVDEHQVRVDLLEHVERGLHGERVRCVPGDRDDRGGLPARGGPLAEDPVEVLLAQHRPGAQPTAVEPLDHGREAQVGGPVQVADLAERAVVDRVRRDAAAIGPHPGHHHHVVGDGLHHRQRRGARVVQPALAQRHQVRHQPAVDLVGPAAVDDQHVGALPGPRPRGVDRGAEARGGAETPGRTPPPPAPYADRRAAPRARGRTAPRAAGSAGQASRRPSPTTHRARDATQPAGPGAGRPRRAPPRRGPSVVAGADDVPVHLRPRGGDVEHRVPVAVEVQVLDVPVVGLDRGLHQRRSVPGRR